MKKHNYYIVALIAVLMLSVSCGDDDSGDVNQSDVGSTKLIVPEYVSYTLTVKCDGSISKVATTDYEEVSAIAPAFTEEDVAKPLVMTVTGDHVSGTLTLTSTEGTFAGTLCVPKDIADTLVLTGTVDIPAAGGNGDDRSIISLDDLMKKCGHRYTAKFRYATADPVDITDSRAYFYFKMSPWQKWLMVNNDRYTVSQDGEVWIAVDGHSSVMTNFYKISYDKVDGGHLYTIDRDGYVDLGIFNTLWADKNVGADNPADAGEYYVWDDAMASVTAPDEVPRGGLYGDRKNDLGNLYDLHHSWQRYNDIGGSYFVHSGCYDFDNDPCIFLPAAGNKVAGMVTSYDELALYWSSTEVDGATAYRLYFHSIYMAKESYKEKNAGEQPVRAIRRGNLEEYDEDDKQKVIRDIYPFFPADDSFPAENVLAWYTCKDYEKMEEWSLYIFNNKTYLLTKYEAKTISRVLCNDGTFTIYGKEDPKYNNFTMVAVVGSAVDTVQIVDGALTFKGKAYERESGEMPEESETTPDNRKDPVQYFPFKEGFRVEDVIAWFRQVNAPDNNYLTLYLFKDSRYTLTQTKLDNKGQVSGSTYSTGSYKSPRGTDIDFYNGVIQAYIPAFDEWVDVTFTNGVGSIDRYGFTMDYQDLDILGQLVGY